MWDEREHLRRKTWRQKHDRNRTTALDTYHYRLARAFDQVYLKDCLHEKDLGVLWEGHV